MGRTHLKIQFAKERCLKAYKYMVKLRLNPCGTLEL